MTPPPILIPARTERQAMDWSLVLASQGIAPVIDRSAETGAWGLFVEPHEYPQAVAIIQQYQLENRGWKWRQPIYNSNYAFHWGVLLWVLLVAGWYWAAYIGGSQLDNVGVMSNVRVAQGEWWRLFTAVSLHVDLAHLASNLAIGILVLGCAMAAYGAGCALLITFFAGALGNVFGLVLRPDPYLGEGASGMVMGALGLMTVHSLSLWRDRSAPPGQVLRGLLSGVLLFMLVGLSPSSDVLAHLGGYIGGLIGGGLMAFLPPSIRSLNRLQHGLVVLTLALFIGTWLLAIRGGW